MLPGALASFQGLPRAFLIVYLVNFVIIFFLGGPLGEEIGWRGFALPRMQLRYGPLWGTLLLGVLWVFWHLPHFLTSAQRGGPGTSFATFLTNFPIFFLMVIAMAIIFTWVFNHTRGSLFMAILLHASINTFSIVVPLFAAPIVTSTDLPILIGVAAAALADHHPDTRSAGLPGKPRIATEGGSMPTVPSIDVISPCTSWRGHPGLLREVLGQRYFWSCTTKVHSSKNSFIC